MQVRPPFPGLASGPMLDVRRARGVGYRFVAVQKAQFASAGRTTLARIFTACAVVLGVLTAVVVETNGHFACEASASRQVDCP